MNFLSDHFKNFLLKRNVLGCLGKVYFFKEYNSPIIATGSKKSGFKRKYSSWLYRLYGIPDLEKLKSYRSMSDKKNKIKAIFDKDNKSPSDINLLKDLIKLISLLDKEIKIIYILYLSGYTLEDISEKNDVSLEYVKKSIKAAENIITEKLEKLCRDKDLT